MVTLEYFADHVKGFSQSEHLNEHDLILNFALGLAGETGEFIDVLKKHLFHGDELDRTKLIKEAGDVCFYLVGLQQKCGAQIYLEQREIRSDYSIRSNLLKLHSISGSISQSIDDYYIGSYGPYYKERLTRGLKEFSQKLSDVLLFYNLTYEEIFDVSICSKWRYLGEFLMNTQVKEITAYQCTCGKAYLAESAALSCCAQPSEKKCNCGALLTRIEWRCNECRDRAKKFEWECAERAPVTFNEILYSKWADKYIPNDPGDFIDSLELDEEKYRELLKLSLDELARKFQIYLCKPEIPSVLNLNEQYEDFCFEDQELPGDWEVAELAIEKWIESVPLSSWPQCPTKVAWNGSFDCNDKEKVS